MKMTDPRGPDRNVLSLLRPGLMAPPKLASLGALSGLGLAMFLGAGLALMFTPRSGKQLRQWFRLQRGRANEWSDSDGQALDANQG